MIPYYYNNGYTEQNIVIAIILEKGFYGIIYFFDRIQFIQGGERMVFVKEFLGYDEIQERAVNSWLKAKGDSIEIIDIKYSVSCIQSSLESMSPSREFSGILIIYKRK